MNNDIIFICDSLHLTLLLIICSHEENSSAGGQHLSTCFAKQQYLNLKNNMDCLSFSVLHLEKSTTVILFSFLTYDLDLKSLIFVFISLSKIAMAIKIIVYYFLENISPISFQVHILRQNLEGFFGCSFWSNITISNV